MIAPATKYEQKHFEENWQSSIVILVYWCKRRKKTTIPWQYKLEYPGEKEY